MKNLLLVLFLLLFQITEAQCIREAAFVDGPDYGIDGTAILRFSQNGTKIVEFSTDFSTTSGPDLHVFLSQSSTVSTPEGVLQTPNTIDLGLLKSPFGTQTYDLSTSDPVVDIDSYDHVIIHCVQYDHYWGAGSFAMQTGADCGSLSVAALEDAKVLIYPTRVKGSKIMVELKSDQKGSLFISSLLGQIVLKPVALTEKINTIEIPSLKSGIYLVHLNFGNQIRTQKIIID